ncbi:MAG: hypothetical protein IKS55_02520 [Oscillospiraceae bacterium]|nr:hypothetical protein [Oscillospiraceae bacterium]
MSVVDKTYRPKERCCAWCGGLVICRDANNWGFKCRDYRNPKSSKKVVFCSWPCLQAFRSEYGPEKERMVLK